MDGAVTGPDRARNHAGLRSLEFGVGSQINVPIIGASNFFELAVATAIALFGPSPGQRL